MNAAEMATNLEFASKIATAINLFKREFPDAKSDLKPWKNDPDTRELMDPDSIDIGFHFPGISRSWRSRSLLFQIRFYHDQINNSHRAIGIEVVGFDHRGVAWKLSTIDNWSVIGENTPIPEICDKLKQLCHQIIEIFNQSSD